MSCSHDPRYRFGRFTLDLGREALFENGREIRLRPKCFQVLTLLVENRGSLVTKSRLHDAVWPVSVVTDDSLAHCIIEIRRALGEHGHDMIRTVPRRGYIFEPPVEVLGDAQPAGGSTDSKAAILSPASGLAAIALVVVIAVAVAWHRADAPLSGADEVTPAARIGLDTNGGSPARGGDEADSAGFVSAAYDEYRQGQFFYNRRAPGDIDRAEEAFLRAVDIDSTIAPAWTGLAAIYHFRLFDGTVPRGEALRLLGEAAHRALALGPDDGEALARMASYYLRIGELRLAAEHFERALAIEPANALLLSMLAGHFAMQGRLDEAVILQRRAVGQDPLSAVYRHNLVSFLIMAGRTRDASSELEQVRALNPSDEGSFLESMTDLLILEKRYEQALPLVLEMDDETRRNCDLAIIYDALGRQAQADAALSKLIRSDDPFAPYTIAAVYAQRGDTGQAFAWLNKPGGIGYLRSLEWPERQHVNFALMSPFLEPVRSDRRWQAMLAAVQTEIDVDEALVATALREQGSGARAAVGIR